MTITDVDGDRPRPRPCTTIDWSIEAAEKGGYEHFMLKEIHEQPESLAPSIAGRVTRDDRIHVDELAGLEEHAPDRHPDRARRLRHAPPTPRSSRRARSRTGPGLPARGNIGSEFRYSPPPLDEQTLVIAVTQSGETADTIAPTRLAREQGCPLIAVTNTVGSAITREADAVLFLQAGPGDRGRRDQDVRDPGDDAGPARGGDRQGPRARSSDADERELVPALRALPAAAARALERRRRRPRRSSPAATSTRGASCSSAAASTYPVALEGALKLKEVSYVHAEGYAAGELKHGPISLLDAECPLVAVATRSSVYDKLISNVMEGRARDARVIAVATEGDEAIGDFADDICWVPDTHEALSPVLAIIPLQLFAYHVADRPGHGRRPAAQPRQVGHGRVGTRWPTPGLRASRAACPPARPSSASTSSRSSGSAAALAASGRASRGAS